MLIYTPKNYKCCKACNRPRKSQTRTLAT